MGVIKTQPRGTVDLAMTVFCFLCNADISQGSMKTKRKRLSGESAKKAVGVLDELSAASYGRKISLIFDKHQDYICHKCQRKAEGLPDLQKKVENEKKEITDLISRYFTGGRKRTRDESECSSRQFVVDETLSTFDSSTPTRSADSRSTGDKDIPVLVSCML